MDLVTAIQNDRENFLVAVDEQREAGITLATKESQYQSAKHTTALSLKQDGYPATMIQMILKGDKRVRDALFARDCAQIEYEAAKERVNALKLSARLLENQLQREWYSGGNI